MDSAFKTDDIGKEAVDDIIERLKTKRTMNNKEVSYLQELMLRANDYGQKAQSLVWRHDVVLMLQCYLKTFCVLSQSRFGRRKCQ